MISGLWSIVGFAQGEGRGKNDHRAVFNGRKHVGDFFEPSHIEEAIAKLLETTNLR
jgi:hypothetical protein